MSYMYYSVFGSIVTVVVGCIVSLLTDTKDFDSKLVHPVLSRFVKPNPTPDGSMIDEKPHQIIVNSLSTSEKQCEKF